MNLHDPIEFTYATAPGTGATGENVVARYTLDTDCRLVASSRRVVLRVPNTFAGHQAGDLAFLPDGTLLILDSYGKQVKRIPADQL